MRLSSTFVTIFVTLFSCNFALSVRAETHLQNSAREITSKTTIDSPRKAFLASKHSEIEERLLSQQELVTIDTENTSLSNSDSSCRIKIAVSTPKCNSQQSRSVITYRQEQKKTTKEKNNTRVLVQEPSKTITTSKHPLDSNQIQEISKLQTQAATLAKPQTSPARQINSGVSTKETLTTQNQIPQETIPSPESPTPQEELPEETIPSPESPTPQEELPEETIPSPESPTPQEELPEETIPSPESPTPQEQAPANSQEPRVLVAEVAVVGVEDELQDLVYANINTQPGRTTTRSQLQEDINAVYATGLFQNIEVTPEDTPLGVRITFVVQANPILSQVVVDTIPPETEQRVLPEEKITEIFGDRYGEILNLRELQDGIKQINEWYSENGYELAQVVGSPQVSPDGTVTLVVAEGVIEDIQVRFFDEENELTEGKTRDFIVTREIELQSGDIFKRDIAQRDLQRVFGLGIFEDVRLSFSPGENPSKVIVNVDVVESSTGSVAAGAGFSSSSGLFGTVSYQQQNLGGNNQTLGTEFQLGERELLFDVSFSDPWIAGDPYRTSYTINAFRRRSISLVFDGDDEDIETADGEDSPRVVRTGGGVNFSRPLSDNPFKRGEWTLSTGFQYQRVSIKNEDGDVSPVSREEDGSENLAFSDSGNDDLFIFRFGATQDKRNSRLQPTSGSLLRLGVDQTVPIGSGSIFLNRFRASYSYYIPLNIIRITEGPQALAFNVQAGTVLGDLPPYEAFVIGGSNSVRGFAEGEVGNGRSYFQATAEYRFPIFRIVGGALFFDYGTVLGTDGDVPGEPSIRRELPGSGFGYGLGIRVQSPLGPIRVDYAINDDGDNRIHFGIGERF